MFSGGVYCILYSRTISLNCYRGLSLQLRYVLRFSLKNCGVGSLISDNGVRNFPSHCLNLCIIFSSEGWTQWENGLHLRPCQVTNRMEWTL